MRIGDNRPTAISSATQGVTQTPENQIQPIRPPENAQSTQKDTIDLQGNQGQGTDSAQSGRSKIMISHPPFDWNVESLEGTPADLAAMDPRHADLMHKLANQIQAKMVSATPV